MVLLRRRVGYRLLRKRWLLLLAAFLFAMSHYFTDPPLRVYMWLVLLFWICQIVSRWRDLQNGVLRHSFSPGISLLDYLPWPRIVRSHRRLYRFLDPILCFSGGYFLFKDCPGTFLGEWFMVSAACLFLYEREVYTYALNHELDVLDGLVDSEIQSGTSRHFDGKSPEGKAGRSEETAGVPTGLAGDIREKVKGKN